MSAPANNTLPTSEPRVDLRIRMVEGTERRSLDGGWWPQSRDLDVEMNDLVRDFPADRGRIIRALFSRPDWDTTPRRVDLGAKVLKVGSFPRDDTHLMVVQTANRERLTLLVIPSSFSAAQGEAALSAASRAGNSQKGGDVLVGIAGSRDGDSEDRWRAEGGASRHR